MTNDRMELLDFLKHQAVTAVIFSKNNLQLELDTATLTCLHAPIILGESNDYTPTHQEYKNVLCRFIGAPITIINEDEKGLVLSFACGELFFPTKGPEEVLIITDGNGEWHSYPSLETGTQ